MVDLSKNTAAPLTDRLAKFFDHMMEVVWEHSDPEGADIQDIAEKLGLIQRVDFDPNIHSDHYGIGLEPGDDWFQLAPDIRAALAKAKA